VGATGLAADPKEYRSRLAEQSDDQIDAWCQVLMRDMAIRRGVVRVMADFRKATGLSETDIERVFASGDAPPASLGRDVAGNLMVPAITLHALVPGLRAQVPDARDRLIEYLVENFHDFVYA
jgi:hypothetical protein